MSTDQSGEATPLAGKSDAELLAEFLHTRDMACPRCRYNLRMLRGQTCPECGLGLVIGVHATEPILRAWICSLVAAALIAGIGLLFLTISLGSAGMPPTRYWWIMFSSIAGMPFSVVLIWKRREFTRLNDRAQWSITIACCVWLVAILIGLFTIR